MWTPAETEYLRTAYAACEPVRHIAFALKKSAASVRVKASRLGVSRRNVPWPEGAIKAAVDCLDAGRSRPWITQWLVDRYGLSPGTAYDIYKTARADYFRIRQAAPQPATSTHTA